MAVEEFNRRLPLYLEYMRLSQSEFGDIINKSPQTVSAYCSTNEKRARQPDFGDLVALPSQTGLSLNWLLGAHNGSMWNDELQAVRLMMRREAQSLVVHGIHARLVAVVNCIRRFLPIAGNDWFAAGLLGLAPTGSSAKENIPLFRQFCDLSQEPEPGWLRQATQRLSEFTGLSLLWLQLGDPKYLDGPSGVDLGAWLGIAERATPAGHTPAMYHKYFETITEIFREHGEPVK